jgi:hypothetical protein
MNASALARLASDFRISVMRSGSSFITETRKKRSLLKEELIVDNTVLSA